MDLISKPGHLDPKTPERAEAGEEPMMYCPVCDAKLSQSRCKLRCRRCGYYMSCADYY